MVRQHSLYHFISTNAVTYKDTYESTHSSYVVLPTYASRCVHMVINIAGPSNYRPHCNIARRKKGAKQQ